MKKPLLIIAICLFACVAKAQTDSSKQKGLFFLGNPDSVKALVNDQNTVFSAVEHQPKPHGNFG